MRAAKLLNTRRRMVKPQFRFEPRRRSVKLTPTKGVMSLREIYRQSVEAGLQEQKAKLDLLRARAKRAAAHSKILAYEELAVADHNFAAARARLQALAGAGGKAISELKSGFNRAFSDLKSASQRAAYHLRADLAAPPASQTSTARTKKAGRPARKRRAARPARVARAAQ